LVDLVKPRDIPSGMYIKVPIVLSSSSGDTLSFQIDSATNFQKIVIFLHFDKEKIKQTEKIIKNIQFASAMPDENQVPKSIIQKLK